MCPLDALFARTIMLEMKGQLNGRGDIDPDVDMDCIWVSAGVVPYKLCDLNFDCGNCAFDLVMRGGNNDLSAPIRVNIKGYKLCLSLFYHQCHTWARVEQNAYVRVGIDDFGQNLLGEIQGISLPIRGEKLGRDSIRLKGRGAIITLMPPVEGFVVESNDRLMKQPSLLNEYPYDAGWIVHIRPFRLAQNLKGLLYGPQAQDWFDAEINRLSDTIAETIGMAEQMDVGTTLQDGGMTDFELLDKIGCVKTRQIVRQFFSLAAGD